MPPTSATLATRSRLFGAARLSVARKKTARRRSFLEYSCEAPGSGEKDAERSVQTAKATSGASSGVRASGARRSASRSRKTRRARTRRIWLAKIDEKAETAKPPKRPSCRRSRPPARTQARSALS
jgi:hypothetical protein